MFENIKNYLNKNKNSTKVNIEQKIYQLDIKEIWTKEFQKSDEEISMINEERAKGTWPKPKLREGKNLVEIAIATYENKRPDGLIYVPKNTFSAEPLFGQEQIILNENEIIKRTIQSIASKIHLFEGKYFELQNVSKKRREISHLYANTMKNTLKEIITEPTKYLFCSKAHGSDYNNGNDIFSVVVLLPKEQVSFDNWWNGNKIFLKRNYSNELSREEYKFKTIIIYENILKPELKKNGFEIKN